MAPDRLLNLVHFHLLDGKNEEGRTDLEERLVEADAAWDAVANPEGTDRRPLGAPAWWDEETAGAETLAGAKALQGRVARNR